MDRICPRDFTLLTVHAWGAATYLYCPTCRGVLLERQDVETIVRSGTHPRTDPPAGGAPFEDGTALCSCSEVRMLSVTREGVTVDVCPVCKAIWFDGGELERVVAENRQKFVRAPTEESPGVTSEPESAVDIVLFVLNLLSWLPY